MTRPIDKQSNEYTTYDALPELGSTDILSVTLESSTVSLSILSCYNS